MRRPNVLAGAGGIAFGVLNVVSFAVGNTPGGTYVDRTSGPTWRRNISRQCSFLCCWACSGL